MLAAAGGALATIPGLSGLLGSAETEAPALDGGAEAGAGVDAGLVDTGGPVVAHVRDAATGELGILNGTREVVVRDPRLVTRLLQAARQ